MGYVAQTTGWQELDQRNCSSDPYFLRSGISLWTCPFSYGVFPGLVVLLVIQPASQPLGRLERFSHQPQTTPTWVLWTHAHTGHRRHERSKVPRMDWRYIHRASSGLSEVLRKVRQIRPDRTV